MYKAITTKYHGPSNVKGSRITARDSDGNKVIISYDDASKNPHRDAAEALCRKMNWTGRLAEGGLDGGRVYVFINEIDEAVGAAKLALTEIEQSHSTFYPQCRPSKNPNVPVEDLCPAHEATEALRRTIRDLETEFPNVRQDGLHAR